MDSSPTPQSAYASHLALLGKLDEKLERQGELDPATWIAVDAQILDCLEKRLLSVGQYIQLHGHIENVLRANANLLGWG